MLEEVEGGRVLGWFFFFLLLTIVQSSSEEHSSRFCAAVTSMLAMSLLERIGTAESAESQLIKHCLPPSRASTDVYPGGANTQLILKFKFLPKLSDKVEIRIKGRRRK